MSYPRKYPTNTGDNHPDFNDWNAMVDRITGFTSSGTFRSPYSYLVDFDGTDYYACNAYQVVYGGPSDAGAVDGGDPEAVIQAALDNLTGGRSHKETVKLKGTYTLAADDQIKIPSYTTLDLTDALVTTHDSTTVATIVNKNWAVGDSNIEIIGGVIDGGDTGVVGGIHTIHMHKVSNLKVTRTRVFDSKTWALCPDYCDGVEIDGFVATSSLGQEDGIHLYDTINANISNCNLNTGDDSICVESVTRDVYGININNVVARSATADGIKFYNSGAGLVCRDINVANYYMYNPYACGIIFLDDSTGDFKDITVTNFHVYGTQTDAGVFIEEGTRLNLQGKILNVTGASSLVATYVEDSKFDIQVYDVADTKNAFQLTEANNLELTGKVYYVAGGKAGPQPCIAITTGTDNTIHDMSLHDGTVGVYLAAAATYTRIHHNLFRNQTSYAVNEVAGADYNIIDHNQLISTGDTVNLAGSHSKAHFNTGYVTENSGTGSITSGTTSDVIAHGCAYTPAAADITITLTENPTNTPGAIWVDTIGAANFTVNCENDPGASNLDFSWSVRKA